MSNPPYTPKDDALILRLRAEGWGWILISWAIGKGHTPSGVDRHWQNLMRDARIAAAEAADAARPKARMVVPDPSTATPAAPAVVPANPSASSAIKSYWPDGWVFPQMSKDDPRRKAGK